VNKIHYKARAVCNHDALLVKAALEAKREASRHSHWQVSRITVSGCILSFTVKSNEYWPADGVSVLSLLLTRDDSLLDCHRLVGTVAPAETFTGEVIEGNYKRYDGFIRASEMSDDELLDILVTEVSQ